MWANRPWQVLGAFKRALAAVFATAAYAMIFPSVWQISHAMGAVRPLLIMLLSLPVLVGWIIAGHGLWERPSGGDRGLTRLYNTVTVTTLALITVFGYLVVFVVVFGLSWLFIPMPYFAAQVPTQHAGVWGYLALAWLLSSLAMLAAALGQGLEDDETVRRATFGYRQYLRARQRDAQRTDPQQW